MKTYLMGAAAAAMILTACSGSNESAETGSFTTPGLTFADAHGHVKSINVTTSSAELKGDSIVAAENDFYNSSVTYTFDEEGRLKTYTEAFEEKPLLSYQVDYQADSIGVARNILANEEAALPVRLTFDDKGHIVKFEYAYDDYSEMSRNITWEWDDQGRITSEYFTGCEWPLNTATTSMTKASAPRQNRFPAIWARNTRATRPIHIPHSMTTATGQCAPPRAVRHPSWMIPATRLPQPEQYPNIPSRPAQ